MIPKVEVVQHVNYIVRSIGIFLAEFVENPDLDECLMMKSLFVADDFDCDILVRFVVEGSNHLPEAPLSNHLQDLVTVTNVIVDNLRTYRMRDFN